MPKKDQEPNPQLNPDCGDYKQLVKLLAIYSDATARVKEMEGEMDQLLLLMIDDKRKEFAELQLAANQAEAALEVIARNHTEWFADKRSVDTPYGQVKFTRSTSLEIKNEELTLELIRRELIGNAKNKKSAAEQYLRTEEKPNLEALEKLDDIALAALRIERVENDNFSVKPKSIDMGKGIKAADKKKAKKAAKKEVAA